MVPIFTVTIVPGVITLELLAVIVSTFAEVRTTPYVVPIGTAASVTWPVEVEISTSAKVSPTGIEKEFGNVKIKLLPALMPVGVVNTNVWSDNAFILTEDMVSESEYSTAAYTDETLRLSTSNPAKTLKM